MQKIVAAVFISSLLLLSACNTVQGLGQDIESVGNAGEDAIN